MDDWDDGWDNDGGYDDGNDEGGCQEEGYHEDVVYGDYGEYDEYHGEYYGEYDDDDSDVEGFGYEQSSNPLTAPADDDDDYDDWFVWSTGYGQGRYEWQEAGYQRQLRAWQEAEYRRQQAEYEQRWAVWQQAEDELDERRRKVLADLVESSAKLVAWWAHLALGPSLLSQQLLSLPRNQHRLLLPWSRRRCHRTFLFFMHLRQSPPLSPYLSRCHHRKS
jgi:hypothetical protein